MTRFYKAFFFFLILPIALYSQYKNIKFERISVEQGLSHAKVFCIIQDSKGFMWFGTASGLCRYDGFNLKVYKHLKGDDNSIRKNKITNLFVDREGTLWISAGWLHKYNYESDNFTRYPPDSLFRGYINDIEEDRFGTLWISINRNRLLRFDRIKEEFSAVYFSMVRDTVNKEFKTLNILISKDDILWVATRRGLYKHQLPLLPVNNKKTGLIDTLEFISYNKKMPNGISKNWTKCLFEDHEGTIWFAQTAGNIRRYDNKENKFINYPADPDNKHGIRSADIKFINENEDGCLLIGTDYGCSIFDTKLGKYTDRFFNDTFLESYYRDRSGVDWYGTVYDGIIKVGYKNKKFPPPWEYDNDAIFVDKNGIVWLGSRSGLHELNRKTGEYNLYHFEIENQEYLYGNNILSLCEDTDNFLWISKPIGLFKFDKNTKSFLQSAVEIGTNRWTCIYRDKTGILWLGKRVNGDGLYHYNPFSKTIIRFARDKDDKKTISHNGITKIFEDSRKDLWIGTQKGLNKFDRFKNRFTRYYLAGPESEGYQHEEFIHDILEPQNKSNGLLWIAAELGLYKFDRETGRFSICRLANGQAVNEKFTGSICRIAEDGDGNIWFSSNNGLGKYDPINKTLKMYYESDGLQGNAFTKAHFKSKSGEMFFGGSNGFSAFFPDSIKEDPFVPEIVFTRFKKMNNEARLDTSILYIKNIILAHDENVFSFEYAALNFTNPRKNQFAHKLEGFDQDWIYTGNKHEATYTNIDPGEYKFCVKGSNSDGIWNEAGTSVKIIITPPWWRTDWAYSAYVLLFVLTLYAIRTYDRKRQRLKHELEIEHLHAENLEEVDKIKSRFFANISHEFRTPLTLIKGSVKQIMDGEFAGNLKQQCKMILRNSDRLLGLINQILDLSKLESGETKLQVAETDIFQYLRGMVLAFSPLADRKKVTLKFATTENLLTGYVDRDKLEKIVTNLLSNAFKFTPEGGMISVNVFQLHPPQSPLDRGEKSVSPLEKGDKGGCLKLTITNTGPGIAIDRMDKIFDRFYQADNNYKKDGESSGIGLALTKELVEVCHGEITVSSIPKKTTTFVVILPIVKECFNDDEITQKMETADRRPQTEKQHSIVNQTPVSGLRSPLILIVEDNPDVTSYISSFMHNDYRIITAENGKEGLKKSLDKYPDLIISDIMMPEMDGFELCQKVKSDERISHIPVILLTAKADLDSKIDGLEFGADDYVTKPFESRELQIRSKNLIEQRKKLREKFSALIDLNPADIAASSMDEQLLQRLLAVFEDHMEEPEFSIEQLAREIGMSRIHLNRKIQAITNLSTSDFIRTLRLQRAARLLSSASGAVSEIAYKVGFNNLSYFSRAFRKHFGKLPSEFPPKK